VTDEHERLAYRVNHGSDVGGEAVVVYGRGFCALPEAWAGSNVTVSKSDASVGRSSSSRRTDRQKAVRETAA